MNDLVVFCGPSISHAEAAAVLDAEYLPPVGRGDLVALLRRERPPRAVGIVDGRFLHALSISPKEVLVAMDKGMTVFGAASMGALRAVECASYGMHGVGQIFEWYRDARTDQEDEVAVTYDPETLTALSEPMIGWRITLADAVAAGTVPVDDAEAFLALAKSIYFPARTLDRVLADLAGTLDVAELARLQTVLGTPEADVKRSDAVAMLRRMAEWSASPSEPASSVALRAVPTGV